MGHMSKHNMRHFRYDHNPINMRQLQGVCPGSVGGGHYQAKRGGPPANQLI